MPAYIFLSIHKEIAFKMGHMPASKWAAQMLSVYWDEIWKHMWLGSQTLLFPQTTKWNSIMITYTGCTQEEIFASQA